MKISIVVPIVGNFGRRGFYHSQEIGLGKEIASYGHEVQVYKCVPLNTMDRITEEKHDGINVTYIPTMSIGPHGLFNPSIIKKNTDVVFAFSDTQLIIPRLYRYCIKNNIKFIPYVGIAHSFQKNIKSRIMDMIFRKTTLNTYKKEYVLAKTEAAKSELKKLGVNNCEVAPVGLDFDSLKYDFEKHNRIDIRKKWGFNEKDIIISFIARLQPEKKPLELLGIFKSIKSQNKKLVIVGDGPLKKDLKEKIIEEGLTEKVVMIPKVEYKNMWEIHYLSDYFVNLRRDEIFGMAVMEAVYYKSCVIAITAPGPDTILKGMKSHYICKSYPEISSVINELETKKNYDSRLIDQLHLKDNFSWNICVDRILRITKNNP